MMKAVQTIYRREDDCGISFCARSTKKPFDDNNQLFYAYLKFANYWVRDLGGTESSNDADAILQTLLDAAGERLRQLDSVASCAVNATKADSHTPQNSWRTQAEKNPW